MPNKTYSVDQGDGNILEVVNNSHLKLREKEIFKKKQLKKP